MNALCDMVYLIIVLSVLSRFILHLHNFLQCTAPYCSVVHICGNVIQFGSQLFVGRQRRHSHQLYLSPEHWLDGAIPGSGVRLNRAGGMVVTPACHPPRFSLASFAGPTAFYLISNFGVWFGWRSYPPTWGGLFECYIAGIPYYGRTLASTLLFGSVLFGTFEFWSSGVP